MTNRCLQAGFKIRPRIGLRPLCLYTALHGTNETQCRSSSSSAAARPLCGSCLPRSDDAAAARPRQNTPTRHLELSRVAVLCLRVADGGVVGRTAPETRRRKTGEAKDRALAAPPWSVATRLGAGGDTGRILFRTDCSQGQLHRSFFFFCAVILTLFSLLTY